MKMEPCKVWIEQCNAARRIDDQFGTDKALEYLVGEKFLNFPEVTETDPEFRTEVPAFATEVKAIFEPWRLAEYLVTARQTEPFDPDIYECVDPETFEDARQNNIRHSARNLLLVEHAKGCLVDDDERS
jgi:hypothetical protein